MKPLTRLVPYSAHLEMSWKNGAGLTREIIREDDATGLLWRLSLATVTQSGPFSTFPELDRIIVLIEGQPMTLHFDDGETILLGGGMPRRFSCDRPLRAAMSSSQHCRDLNLLFRRRDVDAHAESIKLAGSLDLYCTNLTLAICFAVNGTANVSATGEAPHLLRPGDTFIYDNPNITDESGLSISAATPHAELLLFSAFIRR